MAGFRLELPTIQNWSCHNCGGCCKQHAIEISEDEHQRIIDQNWTTDDGIPADTAVVVPFAGPPWKRRYRLNHQADGACVFLDEKGLCRIHAKFGEAAKPLPCRIYPFAFHPSGGKLTISLRYSCPSVVDNLGKPVEERNGELRKLARAILPENADEAPPPRVSEKEKLDWADVRRIVDAIDASLADPNTPITAKLLRTLHWIDLVGQSRFKNVKGAKLNEFLQLIREAATAEIDVDLLDFDKPSGVGFTQLRMLVAQYARKDTFVDKAAGWRGRWRLLRAAIKFARGKGNVPPLQELFSEVPFADVERSFGALPAEVEPILTRFFRVKIQGLHFCGRAYYGVPLVEGFQSLALMLPAVLWLARWLAVSDGRRELTVDDVTRAIAVADHHHGFSPAFGGRSFRRRVRLLSQSGDLGKLCAWYAGR